MYNHAPEDNDGRHSRSGVAILAFLLLAGIAIAHAIAAGFEDAHAPSPQHLMTQQPESLSEDVSHAVNNRIAYDNRGAGGSGGSPQDQEDASEGEAAATILSRSSQLSSLISNLDASDVVECYVVTRMAHLTNVPSSSRGGGNNNNDRRNVGRMLDAAATAAKNNIGGKGNIEGRFPRMLNDGVSSADTPEAADAASSAALGVPPGPVLIRKSALAFRYRPRVAAAHAPSRFSEPAADGDAPSGSNDLTANDRAERRKYFELTLEYGPQRTGTARTAESMPAVRVDDDLAAGNSENFNAENDGFGKYVSWENEGRVYHATSISAEWSEAYYMAAVTGVVFEKIVQRAVEYAFRRPRYQPFEVVSVPSGTLLVRSSGSDDFVWDMFRDLAELYVDIDPILVPPRGKVQFYVADPVVGSGADGRRGEGEGEGGSKSRSRRRPNPNVKKVKGALEGSRAAMFYENFFNCANAIRTGDYSMYVPPTSAVPTPSPVSALPSSAPGIAANYGNGTGHGTLVEEKDPSGHEDDGGKGSDDNSGVTDEGIPDGNITVLEPGDKNINKENYTVEESVGGPFEVDQRNETGSFRRRRLSTPQVELPPRHRNLQMTREGAAEVEEAESNPPGSNVPEGNKVIEEVGDDDHVTGLSLSEDTYSPEESEDDPAEVAEKAAIEAAKAAEDAGKCEA